MAVHGHRDNLQTRPGHGNNTYQVPGTRYQVQLVVPERNMMSNERTTQYSLMMSVFFDEQVRTVGKKQPSCFALTDDYTTKCTKVECVCTMYFGCFVAGESNTGGHILILSGFVEHDYLITCERYILS